MSLGEFFYYAFLGIIGGQFVRYIYFFYVKKEDKKS